MDLTTDSTVVLRLRMPGAVYPLRVYLNDIVAIFTIFTVPCLSARLILKEMLMSLVF